MDAVEIDRKKNTVLVKLNTRFYRLDSILKVAQEFSAVCKVNVEGDVENSVQVKLKPRTKDAKINEIGFEFLNHVLAEMKIGEDA